MAELNWQGKQQIDRISGPRCSNLSFRTLEILDAPSKGGEGKSGWYNRLLWGDNLYAMKSLLGELVGKITLIYLDPPFATGGNYSLHIPLGEQRRRGGRTIVQERAYGDAWKGGLDSYLEMMHERLFLMKELLAEDGSIYIHLDQHAVHYVKVLMDEVFGRERFQNEIIWCYRTMQTTKRTWARKHDNLLFYTKGKRFTFHQEEVLDPYPGNYERRFKYTDEQGRRFMIRGKGGPFGYGQGDISKEDEKRYPHFTYRQYMRHGTVPKDWWAIEMLNSNSHERLGYPTQKPEALLERIIRASSSPGDLVADFFCGSGTTLVMAEKLGRRWIGADLSPLALQLTRKRLFSLPGLKPFEILSLRKDLRIMTGGNETITNPSIDSILKLYQAQPMSGRGMLHGVKEGRTVHVGDADSEVNERELRETVEGCASSGANGLDVLGWDFAVGIMQRAREIGENHSIDIRLVQIPHKILEGNRGPREPLHFFPLFCPEIEVQRRGNQVNLTLKGITLSYSTPVPWAKIANAQDDLGLVDYWAVDFDYQESTFHNMWRSFRTKDHPELETRCTYRYRERRDHRILIKVVNIIGNEGNQLLDFAKKGGHKKG